jgi:hypothetical protein
MNILKSLFSTINLILFLFSLIIGEVDILVYASIIVCIFMVLDKLGKGIVLRELVALFNSLIYLFMPLMGYYFYTKSNPMAAKFIRYMPMSKEDYFSVALPAITGFIFVLCLPLSGRNSDEGQGIRAVIDRVKVILTGRLRLGLWMMAIGTLASLLTGNVPIYLLYVVQLLFLTSFVGVLYLFFSGDTPLRNIYLTAFLIFILIVSLRSGMFTIFAYMGMTLFSFLFLNRRVAMWKKLTYFMMGVFVMIILQSVKPEYRSAEQIRGKNYIELFFHIVGQKLETTDKLLTPQFMWPIYYRANQGYYVALVQNHIPRVRPYDNGKKLLLVIASAFVPRILWPDKPKSGGLENMKYYAGFTLRGYTMNVGPLGEAYGSFGRNGAIVFMLLLGAFIRAAYRQVFVIARKTPLVVLWIPVIFYEVTYSGENDTLQIVNSILKSSLFVYIIYRAYPDLFKIRQRFKRNLSDVRHSGIP